MWGYTACAAATPFTGFETAFGEIAPRLVAAGHEVTIYCRASQYPSALRVKECKGVWLKYVPSPGGKNLSGLVATLFASLHALVFGRYDLLFFVNVGMGHHAALCRIFGARVVMNVEARLKRANGAVAPRLFVSARAAIRFCNRLITDPRRCVEFMEDFNNEPTMIAYGHTSILRRSPAVREFGIEPTITT